jgi:hypothetical protein
MRLDDTFYEVALSRLASIASTRQGVCLQARQLFSEPQSSMFLPENDISHALACIAEIIDDLYFAHSNDAQAVNEAWERADRHAALHEWGSV